MAQTEKDAVNAMLVQIGEAPVNDIDHSHPDVRSALRILADVNLEIQSKSWWYNTEVWELVPQIDGRVLLPGNTSAITTTNTNWIKRGRYLYNLTDHTFDFSDQTTVDVTVISAWGLEELPPTMYTYLVTTCKKRMQVGFDYDDAKVADIEADATLAFHHVQRQHLNFTAPNALSQSVAASVLQNKSTTR